MKTVFSGLILLAVIALAGFSFAPEGALKGPVLWAGLALLCAAGGVIWWRDKRENPGRGHDEQD